MGARAQMEFWPIITTETKFIPTSFVFSWAKNRNDHSCLYETMTHKKSPLLPPGHLLPQITLTNYHL